MKHLVNLLQTKYPKAYNFSYFTPDTILSDKSDVLQIENGDETFLYVRNPKYGRFQIHHIDIKIILLLITKEEYENIKEDNELPIKDFYNKYYFTQNSIIGDGTVKDKNIMDGFKHLPYVFMQDVNDRPCKSYFDIIKNKFHINKSLIKFEDANSVLKNVLHSLESRYTHMLFINLNTIKESEDVLL